MSAIFTIVAIVAVLFVHIYVGVVAYRFIIALIERDEKNGKTKK